MNDGVGLEWKLYQTEYVHLGQSSVQGTTEVLKKTKQADVQDQEPVLL